MGDTDDAKKELEKLVKDTIEQAKINQSHAQGSAKDAQSIQDQGELTLRAIPFLRPDKVEDHIHIWGLTNETLGRVGDGLYSLRAVSTSTDATVSIYSSELSRADLRSFVWDKPEDAKVVSELVDDFRDLQELDETLAKTISSIEAVGLNEARANEHKPVDLLQSSLSAYKLQSASEATTAGSSLIPLRSAINTLLDSLVARRPKQEKASTQDGKIRSISQQLLRTEIDQAYIDIFASQWTSLNRRLSDTKRKVLTREEWRLALKDGYLFISAFINALDLNKFRN